MDFLKNHYEKIILSLTLVLVTAGAVWLALQAVGVREEMAALGGMKPPVVSVSKDSVTNTYLAALTNGRAPQQVDFDGAGHKIYNPDKILERSSDKTVFTADAIGPKALEIRELRPLALKIRLEQRTVRDRTSVYAYITPEYESGRYADERKVPVREDKMLRFGRNVTIQKAIRLTATKVTMDPKDPDALTAEFDLSIGGGIAERITVKAGEIWTRDIDFEADLYHKTEQLDFPNTRVGRMFTFGGDTNAVIQITEEGVTLRAFSNQKRVTIKKSPTP